MSDWQNTFFVRIPLKDAQMAAAIAEDLSVIYECFEANSVETPACPLLRQYVKQMREEYPSVEEIELHAEVGVTRAGGHELVLQSGEHGTCHRGIAGHLLQVVLLKYIPDGCAGFLWTEETSGAVSAGWIIVTPEAYRYRDMAAVAAEDMRALAEQTNKGILNEIDGDE